MRRFILLLSILSLVLMAGCSGCEDETGSAGGFDGEACTSDSDCLGTCTEGTCTGGGTGADGETCAGDSECLGVCEDGVCTGANNGTANNGGANNGANNGTNNGGELFDPDQTRAEYCAGSGPPIIVGDQSGTVEGICTGDIAQTTFRFALCVCDDYGSSGSLTTDSFDSSNGPYDPNNANPGGAVGINGRYDSSGTANIGGSLWVGSEQGISSGGDIDVANQLRTNGGLSSSKQISVARDAYIAGNVAVQDFSVGGKLFTPSGTNVETQGQIDVVRQDVGQIDPCDCDDRLDIAALVELNRMHNHNDDVGLDAGALSSFNSDQTIELECGKFYLDEIIGSGNVTINVTGRTALFIGGDIALAGELSFNVDDDAIIDVFIAGDLNLSAAYVIGDPARPASARFYSGGEQISFNQSGTVAGNIYAPNARTTFSAPLEVFGSLFAKSVDFSDSLTVHYDEAILTASEECEGTGGGSGGGTNNGSGGTNNGSGGGSGGDTMCTECEDCGNQACTPEGVCGACETDLDCCSPLVCIQGECILYFL